MGRIEAAQQFIRGLSAGVMLAKLDPATRSSAFQDGYAEGRRVAREQV